MNIKEFFSDIASGNIGSVERALRSEPQLIWTRNPDAENWDEISPLHCAARRGHLEIVKLLVDDGAEVYSHPFNSYPAVCVAAWAKQKAIVDYFLNQIPDKADGTNGIGIAINLAARLGWREIVQRHIAADRLSVHQRGWVGDTPLHWPAHNGSVEIVSDLLDAGADIEADEINCYGGKPLHWASEHSPSTVELLLERGANVDSRNEKPDTERLGFTPLIMNATQRQDCAEVTSLLLDAGADREAKDAKGLTAFDYAKRKGNHRILAVLESV